MVAVVACGGPAPFPESTTPRKFDLAAVKAQLGELPADPNIKTGKLANGLTYFILPNHKPEKRAQLWLAVNAGSVQEDEDQHGLAHFVEHMCFNGTRRFPKHEITDFLEHSGSRMGPDINATTSFDETVYKLQVPTDKPELAGKAVTILRDFADGVTFDPGEVERERGVVLEEWRLKRGAGTRLNDQHEAGASNPSAYLTHKPIGNPETIKGAPVATLQRFYKDWYRPDLMAVVAVGDFSAADIESKIKLEFESMKNPAQERERKAIVLKWSDKNTFTLDTDAELTQYEIKIENRFGHDGYRTTKDFRRVLDEQLWDMMLNSRLDELARSTTPPFLSAQVLSSHPARPYDQMRVSGTVDEHGIQDGMAAMLRELLRVEHHGFLASELDRAKAQLLRNATRRAAQADKRDSQALVIQLVKAFLAENITPDPATELAQAKEQLPAIDIVEVNKVSNRYSKGRHFVVSGPPSSAKPSEDALKVTIREVVASNIPPYVDVGGGQPLIALPPSAGAIAPSKDVPELGVTEWRLSNGARVVVKPTDWSSDSIRLSAFAPGGSSLAADNDFDSARFAAPAVLSGGLGSLDQTALIKSLAGKIVHLDVDIDELQERLEGSASVDDLETLFQMMHLSFTAPRRDENAFKSWQNRNASAMKTKQLSPEAAFAEELAILSTQNSPRRHPATAESFQRVNLDKALSFYRERFADASNFTFIFVGNIDVAHLKQLSETYLASLPSTNKHETWKDLGITAPSGVQKKVIARGSEPKSKVHLTFHGPETWSSNASSDMSLLAEVLHLRLREVLRVELGSIYSVSVAGAINRRPKQEYSLNVSFGCAPENVDKLVKAVLDETAKLADKGVDEDTFTKAREIRKRGKETASVDDGWWLRHLVSLYTYADDPKPPPEPTQKASERVKAAAKRYLDPKQYILGVLNPQK
jgi:zinc protease